MTTSHQNAGEEANAGHVVVLGGTNAAEYPKRAPYANLRSVSVMMFG